MSGWFKPGRRHYGRKPNTRRARGLKRRDYGKSRKTTIILPDEYKKVNQKRVAEYIAIYQMYCAAFEEFTDEDLAMRYTMENFKAEKKPDKRKVHYAIRIVEAIRKLNNL